TTITLPCQDDIRSDDILVVARRKAFTATKTAAPTARLRQGCRSSFQSVNVTRSFMPRRHTELRHPCRRTP
ncbi:MAG: hypothetical protein K2K22_01535, partial [Muribaculaceae bacterium]|nr:hypothetical protein [Muribaculaceae bacterium]